jgi:hypothetical protein
MENEKLKWYNDKRKVNDLESMTIDTAKKMGFTYKGYKIMELSRIPALGKKYKNENIFIFKNT